jgi:hypothetical protein
MGGAQSLEVCRVVLGDGCERVLGMISKACGQGEELATQRVAIGEGSQQTSLDIR